MSRAYYNEIDPNAAQWLRNLIAAGHIAPGDVDERSIEDVRPTELVGYTQCHFFAGIGIWSYALRLAGWPDDRPVWTGSCPCQPFSTAGKGEGLADERHLWPAWFHLIEHGKDPSVPVFGEQVANGDGLTWLDLVWADMEGTGYAFRATDACAAGVGAPHIRQRLFFHAFRPGAGLGNSSDPGLEGHRGDGDHCNEPGWIGAEPLGHAAQAGAASRLADASSERRQQVAGSALGDEAAHGRAGRHGGQPDADYIAASDGADCRPGPVNGRWAAADWLWCRDQKWRPVEPCTFPLVDGAPSRVVRLRAYGNGIVSEVAATFIKTCMTP